MFYITYYAKKHRKFITRKGQYDKPDGTKGIKMYNTLLYIGLTLMAVGFVGWVVSICMERHYEVKLWELEQKRKAENGRK